MEARASVASRAGDYQMFAGPVLRVSSEGEKGGGRPLWISWEVERSERGLALPLAGLAAALGRLGLLHDPKSNAREEDLIRSGVNIEYLICRHIGSGNLRAKGKLSIPDVLWRELLPGMDRASAACRLASALEELWQAELGIGPGSSRELTVAWREYWLGHWSATYP